MLEYLDYQTVLSCALTSKIFLHDAMPLVKTLHIDTALQMNIPLTSRFRDVQHINLYSLLKGRAVDEEDEDNDEELLSVNYEAVLRVVPFLSAFPNLSRVFIGGRKNDGDIVSFSSNDEFEFWDAEEDPTKAQTLIDLVSGSFASSGGLLKNVQVMGLRCPYSNEENDDENESECEVCSRACRSFPLDQVINFDNEGSSAGLDSLFSCNRTPCIDVCLSRSVIESIVEERPGGKDLLRSNARLLHLLGNGERHEIRSDRGESLFIVKFATEEKAELERVIEYAELDTKKISSEDVTKAIWSSFSKGDGCKVPPKKQCYLSRGSLNFLIDELGLPIDKEDFGLEAARTENLPQIAKGVMVDDPIQPACLNMLGLVLEKVGAGTSTTIQKVVDLGVVPALVELLADEKEKVNMKKHATLIIKQIVLKGSDENAQKLVDAGVLPQLVLQICHANEYLSRESVLVLGHVATKSVSIRDAVLEEGALAALLERSFGVRISSKRSSTAIKTLESLLFMEPVPNLDDYEVGLDCPSLSSALSSYGIEEAAKFACTALSYICRTPSKHQKVFTDAELFPSLMEMMSYLSPEVQEPALETMRYLIRQDRSLIQDVIDEDRFSSLVSCLLSPVKEVRNEACEVISCLLNGTIKQVDLFVAQGCIRALCGVLYLSNPVLAITSCLGLMKVRVCSAHDMHTIMKTNSSFSFMIYRS